MVQMDILEIYPFRLKFYGSFALYCKMVGQIPKTANLPKYICNISDPTCQNFADLELEACANFRPLAHDVSCPGYPLRPKASSSRGRDIFAMFRIFALPEKSIGISLKILEFRENLRTPLIIERAIWRKYYFGYVGHLPKIPFPSLPFPRRKYYFGYVGTFGASIILGIMG